MIGDLAERLLVLENQKKEMSHHQPSNVVRQSTVSKIQWIETNSTAGLGRGQGGVDLDSAGKRRRYRLEEEEYL